MNMRWKAVIALAAPVLVLAAVQAQQQRAKGSLTALDYVEIQQIYGRYSIGVDSGNGDLFASAFTPDGIFDYPAGPIQGREKLAAFAAKPSPAKGPTNAVHFPTNVTIEPSPEGATATAYVMLVNFGQGGKPSAVVGGGVYHDSFVKGPEGWRLKKRIYLPAHSADKPTQ